MSFLVDIFGYVSILLHGVVLVTQSVALGGVLFLVFLARPLIGIVPAGEGMVPRTARLAGWSALALAVGEALNVALQTAVIVATVSLPPLEVLTANFAVAGLVKITAALLLAGAAAAAWSHPRRDPARARRGRAAGGRRDDARGSASGR